SCGSMNVSAPAVCIIPLTRWNSLPITAPATPCRGIGMDGSVVHVLAAGSNRAGQLCGRHLAARAIDSAAVGAPAPAASSRRHPLERTTPPVRGGVVLLHDIRVRCCHYVSGAGAAADDVDL